jgi:hypothetical protein
MIMLPYEPEWLIYNGAEKYAAIPLSDYHKIVEYMKHRTYQQKMVCLGDLIHLGETYYREGHKRFKLLGMTLAIEVDNNGNQMGRAFTIDPMDLVNKDE